MQLFGPWDPHCGRTSPSPGPIPSMFSMFLLKFLLVQNVSYFKKHIFFHFSFLRRHFWDFSVFSCYLGCFSKTHVSCSRWALVLVTAAKPCDHQGQGGHVFHVPSQISLFFRPSGATLKNDNFSTGPKIHKIDDEAVNSFDYVVPSKSVSKNILFHTSISISMLFHQ